MSILLKPNHAVCKILEKFITHPHSTFFGITSDIDNLGKYVARNGRAKGENLVDHYTDLLDQYLSNWKRENRESLLGLCFIPAGEEVSIFGVAKNSETPTELFQLLKTDFRKVLKDNQHYLRSQSTSITFGCSIYDQPEIRIHIEKFIMTENKSSYSQYLKLMEKLRTLTSHNMDREKFRSIANDGNTNVTLLRTYVYFKVLKHKQETAQELPHIAKHFFDHNTVSYDSGLKKKNERLFKALHTKLNIHDK
jgi:hypothetical protein